ncbi:MAG TPA: 4-hydroxy-3-methylbut-2-enyl diphosphate reductase [Terriglobia bacterium]|nr:4-hydroxy-3-methylbut-2-enyl diphosphate reductase [Terriglobia bacterium]
MAPRLCYFKAMSDTYFQKGFGLKATVGPALARSYRSSVVEQLKELGYDAVAGDLRVKLAREFGFCYGVDRAVEYAYETREQFPSSRIFLCGEIIHNPDVNRRLRAKGIIVLGDEKNPLIRFAEVQQDDVVILPAFGVTVAEMEHLRSKHCVLVDTTCGSVLNVWKKVQRCARDGFTVVIHGKHYHEETRATASQAQMYNGRYLCLRDVSEAQVVCRFLRGEVSATTVLEHFRNAASPDFDPDRDLQRIGLANQTTMLMTESLAIQEVLRAGMRERYGEESLDYRFSAFDTICSATQDRQDAVMAMLAAGDLDLMVVIGGYNSSNTQALAQMCASRLPTYHIDAPGCIESAGIRHRPVRQSVEIVTGAWLPEGPVTLGLTAGASTPDSVVGDVLDRILALRGKAAVDLTRHDSFVL